MKKTEYEKVKVKKAENDRKVKKRTLDKYIPRISCIMTEQYP